MQEITDAKVLTMCIMSELPQVMKRSDAEAALIDGGVEPILLGTVISELAESGYLFCEDGVIAVTPSKRDEIKGIAEGESGFRPNINRARRCIMRLMDGIDYRLNIENAEGGSYIVFERYENERLTFCTKIFFDDTRKALEAYNYIDTNPENVMPGFMIAATGQIKYLN